MTACWPLQIPPTPKAVLISLADNANDEGVCWPSIARICERTCFGKTAVIDAIQWLEQHGLLIADRSNGRHTSYQVVPNGRAPDLFASRTGSAGGQVQRGRSPKPDRQADRFASRTGSAAGPDRSASRTTPVREADTNRQEPSRTRDLEGARSFEPTPDEVQPTSATPSAAAAAAIALNKTGSVRVSSMDPRLIEATAAGVTGEQLVAMHEAYPDKGAAWLITACLNQLLEAKQRGHAVAQQRTQAPRAGPPPQRSAGQLPLAGGHGKTASAIAVLEGMKSGSRMAEGRTVDGFPDAPLPGPGKAAGR